MVLGSRVFSRTSRRIAAGATVALVALGLLHAAAPRDTAPPSPGTRIGDLPERRTATSATRRNRDGSYTTTIHSAPSQYRTDDGSWQRIDSKLYPSREGGFAWRSGANAYEMRFKESARSDFAELRLGGRAIRLHVEGAQDGTARVDGNEITYPRAFPGADLRYRLTATGVQKTIDLAGPDSSNTYTFRLSTVDRGSGLAAQRRSDGSYLLHGAGLPPGLVLDAPAVWEADNALPSAGADPALRVRGQGRDLVVTLSLDRAWLRAPGRRFPVHLDPTITIQPELRAATYRTVANSLPLAQSSNDIGSTSTTTYRSALQFDLSEVPAGAQVSAAQLKVTLVGCLQGSPCGSHQFNLHRMTSAWTRSSTFSQLTHDSTVTASYSLANNAPMGTTMSWSIPSLVSDWVNGIQPNHGVLLKRSTETLGSNGAIWNSGKIDVTYTLGIPDLRTPTTLHADGAELSWAPSTTGTAGYEVHRGSGSASFTPGPTTLLTTIGDRTQTRYRDSTAAAGGTFTYRIKDLANGTVSVPRTVTLPAAGLSSKVLQPGPADGRQTYLYFNGRGSPGCWNFGAHPAAGVGGEDDNDLGRLKVRTALHFDLRDIPPNAQISNASVSVYRLYGSLDVVSVEANRITRPWKEGTGLGTCTGDGASGEETEGGQPWTTPGGDIDPIPAASFPVDTAGGVFDSFSITGLVQSWVSGHAPNNGLMLRAADEASALCCPMYFAADDDARPSLRPKLTITYSDGSAADAPRVSLAAPDPNAKVAGTSVRLATAAEDDRRVDKVDFLVNGAVVGTDFAAPFEVSWDSTSTGNGSKAVTARATDDAGNVSQSAPVNIIVDNTSPPTGSLTAPAAGATVGASATLSATASDDVGVTNVQFLVDGVRVGAPITAPPYSMTWKPLEPLAPVFNGGHQISAVITDTSGQQTVTAPVSVTVNNQGATTAAAGYTLNDPASTVDDVFPSVMAENTAPGVPVQDPSGGPVDPVDGTGGGSLGRKLATAPVNDGGTPPPTCPIGAYCPTIRVTNNSGVGWVNSTAQVWYRWYAPNTAVMFEGRSTAAFPATFGAGATQAFPLTIYPPALPPGVTQGTYQLRIDVYDPATSTWFAAKGNQSVDNPILIVKSLATKLGFERYYQYEGEPVGVGMSAMTNVANGDLLLRWSPFFAPGRGLATMADLTYNSLEEHSKSPVGNNFSLSISGLIRFGQPLDIHPNKADEISGQANKWVEFTDGDGTTHRFIGTTGTDGITRWQEPPGVNLYLYNPPGTDPNRKWALTRPDKVTFYFDADGFPTSVEDRNGNRITYTLENTPPGEDPGGPKKRVTTVTDPGGRSFVIDYWSKDEIKKAHVRGKIQSIRDHSGSKLNFDYYEDGNLLRLTQVGGTNANGTNLPSRSFVFTYTTSNGAGPAIPIAADRVNPEPRTPNQSTRLYSVRDARGAETTFAYYLATDGQHLKWKLKSRTNRAGKTTTLTYDLTNRVTTVTAPLSRVTRYTYDPTGKVTRIVNPLSQAVDVQWSADFKVTKVTMPNGKFTSYDYNANGYPTLSANELDERTVLTYLDLPVDANDTGKHLSLLDTVTRPRGVVTTDPNDYRWRFSYDTPGNVNQVTDPTGAVTDYDFSLAGSANPGTIAQIKDPNGHVTLFEAYDPSGQPSRIKDPLGSVTQIGYTADGLVRWIQDPNHAGFTGSNEREYKAFFDYDEFHRLGRQSAPKSTSAARGTLLWSSVEFDPNDNVVRSIDPHSTEGPGDPENGPVTRMTYDDMDRPLLITGPDTSVDPAGERMQYAYDDAGRLVKVTKPKGVRSSSVVDDFTNAYAYDPLDRIARVTEYGTSTAASQTRHTHACYDTAGDLRSVTSPRAGLASVTCPGTGPATAPFTSTYAYDVVHRLTSQRDPIGHETRIRYDANGNAISQERDIETGRVTLVQIEYNQRDLPEVYRQRFDVGTGREIVTRLEYDANGNRTRLRSPRATDAANVGQPNHYITEFGYDAVNQLIKVTLPFDARDGAERQFVHHSYDPNGNLLWSSLPVTASTPTAVADTARTVMTYFDPGWIRTSDDPTSPKVHFDYNALGQQVKRTPELAGAPGQLDLKLQMSWTYHPDGMLATRSDRGGQSSVLRYDEHNNLLEADDNDGISHDSQKPVDVQASYTGFDEVAKSRFRREGESAWTFSDYTYDANSNVTVRRENGQENDAGQESKAPRRYEMTYDAADWLTQQLDLGTDTACKDDTRTVNAFFVTGWEKQRDTYRAGTGCASDPLTWPLKQTTKWTYFDNGLLRTLQTVNKDGAVLESHDVGYVDDAGIFVNGHRTRDRYMLRRGENSSANTCLSTASPCEARYVYDARDRLVSHQLRAGLTNTYTMDQPAQLIGDQTVRAGNVTTEVNNGVTTTRKYQANQLKEATTAGVTVKYWYTPLGELDCITTAAGSQANCTPADGAPVSNLITDHAYDYLGRLTGTRQYSGGGTLTDESTYVYDPLDRTVTERENHAGTDNDRETNFAYQGMTSLVTEEKQTGGASPKTKTYAYDAYGHRLSMTDTDSAGTPTTYTYGHDVHGSVSQLINDAGGVKASYGYDAYGGSDAGTGAQALTSGDTNSQAPVNPFRYTGRRVDSGQATSATSAAGYDMGARRYGPDVGRFLQQDVYAGALSDLGLALDPLTQNRYSLAGGNPISFVEFDGHMAIANGGGGGAAAPNPSNAPPPPSDKDTQGGVQGAIRFGKAFVGDLINAGKGAVHLYGQIEDCGSDQRQEACEQLEQQFATKEGWKQTWNALKQPFVNDCPPSANRAPECAAHVASTITEVLVGGKGATRAGSAAGRGSTRTSTAATGASSVAPAAASLPARRAAQLAINRLVGGVYERALGIPRTGKKAIPSLSGEATRRIPDFNRHRRTVVEVKGEDVVDFTGQTLDLILYGEAAGKIPVYFTRQDAIISTAMREAQSLGLVRIFKWLPPLDM